MFSARNIHYDLAERTRGLAYGGLGAMHLLAQQTGLIQALDQKLHLLKRHLPYHESDHVLNIAYNILCHGECLEDLERLRNDEVYLDALGAQRIPDPTTAGDFCRRFSVEDVMTLMEIVGQANQRCHQENLIEQLKNGVQALRMPVDNLVSNWAYMVMASLPWTLKAWFALWLPETGRWSQKHQAEKQTVLQMEFKKFHHAFMALPCQIVRTGRRILYRVLAWNQWLRVFFRGVAALHLPLRC